MSNELTIEMNRVRVTVLKKYFHKDFVDQYAANPEKWAECGKFEVGQEFVTSREAPWEMPKGFCSWAWADMQKLVYGMAKGGQDVFVTSCTDGYRPVIFKLEKVKDDDSE
ncbi:MAG: TIGR04076 family protein [Spirochaetales bacterium]|jgi:uncharacterized repeat protein (TIGR04076 family)|nr:TIGR04076 family protein [Spirochaetales bacterium]